MTMNRLTCSHISSHNDAMPPTTTKTCEQCESAEATETVFYLGRRSRPIECCEDCHEDLMLDGEYEATAVTR